eukprot:sb/3465084/
MDHEEIGVYSCHSHNATMRNKGVTHPGTVALLVMLLLCAIASNAALVYVLRRFRRHIDWVVTYYSSLFALTDILKVSMIVIPAMVRLCQSVNYSGKFCYASYFINLFLVQSSLLSLSLAAYDRIMVLRKMEAADCWRRRLKNTFLFSILIPISYMTFDILYTKFYESSKTDVIHDSDRSSLCFDSKLGWCVIKTAPHEADAVEAGTLSEIDLSGSRKAGVFICQAHIMTVLVLISLLTLQSAHTNYKKMYADVSREGAYYLMIFGLNIWVYLPSMFVILMDTFTASVFPSQYYESFYIYIYIAQLLPVALNPVPIMVVYREVIFAGYHTALLGASQHRGQTSVSSAVGVDQPDTNSNTLIELQDRIYRRLSQINLPPGTFGGSCGARDSEEIQEILSCDSIVVVNKEADMEGRTFV